MRTSVIDFQVHLGSRTLSWSLARRSQSKWRTAYGQVLERICQEHVFYGILEEVHSSQPNVRVEQHVGDLALCAVGRRVRRGPCSGAQCRGLAHPPRQHVAGDLSHDWALLLRLNHAQAGLESAAGVGHQLPQRAANEEPGHRRGQRCAAGFAHVSSQTSDSSRIGETCWWSCGAAERRQESCTRRTSGRFLPMVCGEDIHSRARHDEGAWADESGLVRAARCRWVPSAPPDLARTRRLGCNLLCPSLTLAILTTWGLRLLETWNASKHWDVWRRAAM